jgi:tellurite resistance protein
VKGAIQSPYSNDQIAAWLRGLLTVAWADGNFDAKEQELIANITDKELAPKIKFESLEPIEPEELAAVLGKNTTAAENFLRTAVMVAIADGIYSPTEDDLLHKFCLVLGQPEELLKALRYTIEHPQQLQTPSADLTKRQLDGLRSVREWLDKLEIHDPRVARFLCKMIPSQCPFERDVKLFGRKIVHIPPMCKINPLYEQLVGLRFRALSYLADDCREDISSYI